MFFNKNNDLINRSLQQNEMGWGLSRYGGEERYIQSFGG
jgi:hypothetical protein